MDRQFWTAHSHLVPRPLVMASAVLSKELVLHLLRNRSSCAVKKKTGHAITPLQGACSSLVVPLVFPCWISGWPAYRNNRHVIDPLPAEEPPLVVLSALVQPDFEFDNVMMELIRLEECPVVGESGPAGLDESGIKRVMVYHFTEQHTLPSCLSVSMEPDRQDRRYVQVNGKILSLEMLRNIVKTQLTLEQRGLGKIANEHAIELFYTWDPPAIFAKEIGAGVLDELFYEAITAPGVLSDRVVGVAFNDYQNKDIVPQLRRALPHLRVMSKTALGTLLGPSQFKVLHNNGDAFANHILTQPVETSLDGAIGSVSSAAASLCFRDPIVEHI